MCRFDWGGRSEYDFLMLGVVPVWPVGEWPAEQRKVLARRVAAQRATLAPTEAARRAAKRAKAAQKPSLGYSRTRPIVTGKIIV